MLTNIENPSRKPSSRIVMKGNSQDYLIHYGILGQKWGTRRYQNEDGTLTEEGKKRYDKTPESKTWKKSEAEGLSDDELRRRNNRLQAERQYKDLTTTQGERDRNQIKRDIINKVIIGTGIALAAVAMKNHWKQAASFIGKFAKKSFTKIRTSYALKTGTSQLKNAGEQYSHVSGSLRNFRAGKYSKTFDYSPRNYNRLPRSLKWPLT